MYTQVVAIIKPSQSKGDITHKRKRGPKKQTGRKKKNRRYVYARTQDMFRKHPGVLARYIREGTSWLKEQNANAPRMEDVKTFYSSLWENSPDTRIPFASNLPGGETSELDETLQVITAREIDKRLNRLRKNTALGLDGIKRKHILGKDTREILRLLFNIALASGTQHTEWCQNKTILVTKQGIDQSKIENYRPLTIGSILCRTYWGINDRKLRESFTFSPRQKGFVHETGCLNNVHIFDEIIRADKTRDGLVAVQLDIAKHLTQSPTWLSTQP
jgi:hypothetical protein